MLDLSAIKFQVDTSELERAQKTISELAQDFTKIDRASQNSARTQAQTKNLLARADKEAAKARLENAKAADQELKSAIAADRADQAREKSIKKATEATERQSKASQNNVSILERQKDILEFQTQGYSKGQSSILAYGKAAGLATGELQELAKVLDTQRKLMGNDPFDKSLSGIKSLQNQYTELRESLRQYNAGSELTSKQTKELARDKERLIERMKVEGSSFQEIRKVVRAYNQDYVSLANQYNKLSSAEDNVIRQRKELVTATNYVTQADQKMAAALNTSNAAIDKSGTDSLVKYENALRKSGMAQEVVTQKLATYKAQLTQVQAVEEKRRAANLSRALSPQLTDVAVSLYSGQAPLTVLLQQGGQILDLFKLSGIEAQNFGKAMKEAFTSMIPAMATVAKGIGDFIIGSFVDAGRAVGNLIGNITGLSGVMKTAVEAADAQGWTKLSAALRTVGNVAIGITAVGIAAAATAVIAMGTAAVQAIKENDRMAVSLSLTGAAMGLSFDRANDLAQGMQYIGVSTSDAMKVMSEMARQGKLTADDIALVTKSAVDLKTYGGIAIEDTVKEFVKMKEKPVEAMLELAKATGLVTPEVVKAVMELQEQGKTADATALAIKALADVNDQQVARMKSSYNNFSLFLIELGKSISKFFSDAFKDLFYKASPKEQLKKQLAAVDETLNNWGTMKMDAVGAVQMLIPGEKERVENQRKMLLNQIALLNMEEQQYEVQQNQQQAAVAMLGLEQSITDQLDKQNLKRAKKGDKEGFVSSFVEEKAKDAAKSKGIDIELIKSNENLMASYRKLAEIEYAAAHKSDGKKAVKELDTYADILNKVAGLTSSYNNDLATLQKLRNQNRITEEEYVKAVEDLIKAQPFAVKLEKERNDAHELSNKLLGKADKLGKDYYTTLEKIAEYKAKGLYSPEEAKQLEEAAFKQTELAKEQLKYITSSSEQYEKFKKESQKVLDDATKLNSSLDARVELLGLTSDEQKKALVLQKEQQALLESQLKLERQIAAIRLAVQQGKMDPFDAELAILDAQKAYAEERKAINRGVAIAYAEDLDKEIRNVKEGISDSIVDALFQGGKSGSQKMRQVIVDALKRPVTVVVNAMVNSLIGSVGSDGKPGTGLLGRLTGGGGDLISMLTNGFNVAGGLGSSLAGKYAGYLANWGMETASEMVGQFGAGMMNTSSIGAFTSALEAGGAQMAGAIAGSVLNGFSGYSISKLLSGGYQVNKYVDKIAGVASMIPGVGPIAGVIGGVVNRLFGRKLKESGVEGTFGGANGFEGRTYEYYKGGLFRSSKTKYGELDEATRSGFADSFNELKKNVGEMATTLGLGSEALKDFTYSFKINLMGLSEEEATKKLAEQFTEMSNAMAGVVLQTDKYTQGEETRIETLSRLASSLSGVNKVFENMGLTLLQSSLEGADAASQLSDAFGGLSSFVTVMSSYYEKFYTDGERQTLLQTQLNKAFNDLNLTTPTTREEFRRLVEQQDLMTDSGRHTFTELMKLVDGFDQLQSAAEQLREQIASTTFDLTQRVLEAEGNVYESQGNAGMAATQRRAALDLRRKQEYDAMYKLNPELAKLVAHIYELEDAANAASAAAQHQAEVESKRYDLTQRLLIAEGKDREALDLRRKQEYDALYKLDPELAKMVARIYELEDAASAAAEAAAKEVEAKKRLEDIESKRFDLMQRLLIAEGKNREALDLRRAQEYDALWKLDPALAAIVARIYELEDAAEARNKAYAGLERAVAAEKKLLAERIQVTEQSISALTDFFNSLKAAVDTLYNQVNSTSALSYVAARQLVSNAYNTVKGGGVVTPNQTLTEAVNLSVSGLTSDSFRTKNDFDIEKLRLAAQLAALRDSTKASLTTEEKILETLKGQDANLDKSLEYWKMQIDIANGTYEATLSVTDAINNLAVALGVKAPTPGAPGSAGTPTPGKVPDTSGASFGGSSGGLDVSFIDDDGRIHYKDGSVGGAREGWQNDLGQWVWARNSQYYKNNPDMVGKLPGYANGGYYGGGLAMVGENGPEMINFRNPGQVYTANQTSQILSGGDSRISALEASNRRIEGLLASIADSSKKSSDTLRNVTDGGDEMKINTNNILELT